MSLSILLPLSYPDGSFSNCPVARRHIGEEEQVGTIETGAIGDELIVCAVEKNKSGECAIDVLTAELEKLDEAEAVPGEKEISLGAVDANFCEHCVD